MSVYGANEVIAKFGKVSEQVDAAVIATTKKATLQMQRFIKSDELSGQVLNRRTGRLSRSIQASFIQDKQSITGRVGTNLVYARIHEFGGDIYPKRAKALRFEIDGRWIFSKHVHMPERPYLRPALKAESEKFLMQLKGSINTAVNV